MIIKPYYACMGKDYAEYFGFEGLLAIHPKAKKPLGNSEVENIGGN